MAAANRDVFINCPFDSDYQRFFYATVYAVLRSGFSPRCALETDDASENRFEKICVAAEFAAFETALPAICARRDLDVDELTFGDLTELVSEYTAATA